MNGILCVSSFIFCFNVRALTGGEPIDPEIYPAVVLLEFQNSRDGDWDCTATKVAPQKYLTAAHCVADAQSGELHEIHRLTLSHGYSSPDAFRQKVSILALHVHPLWKGHRVRNEEEANERLNSGTDQALIEVQEKNELPAMEVDFQEIQEGEVLYGLGYGMQSVHPFEELPAGQLRLFAKRVSAAYFQPRVIRFLPEDAAGRTYSQFAEGDSGGPILRFSAPQAPLKKRPAIVGIVSYITNFLYVDPQTGELTENLDPESAPTSHFVRSQAVSYLFHGPWSLKSRNWLRSEIAGFEFFRHAP